MSNYMTTRGPRRDLSSLQSEVERAFSRAFGQGEAQPSSAGAWSPALDVEENEDAFTIHVELTGVSPDDTEITLEENVLTIAGERRFYDEKDTDGFRRIERAFGRFHRAVRLPDRVNASGVEATAKDGLLTIHVPKAEEAKPRRIEVKSGS